MSDTTPDTGTYESPVLNCAFEIGFGPAAKPDTWRVHGRLSVSGDVDDLTGRMIDDTEFYPVFAVNAATREHVDLDPHHPEDLQAFSFRYMTHGGETWSNDDLLEVFRHGALRQHDEDAAREARWLQERDENRRAAKPVRLPFAIRHALEYGKGLPLTVLSERFHPEGETARRAHPSTDLAAERAEQISEGRRNELLRLSEEKRELSNRLDEAEGRADKAEKRVAELEAMGPTQAFMEAIEREQARRDPAVQTVPADRVRWLLTTWLSQLSPGPDAPKDPVDRASAEASLELVRAGVPMEPDESVRVLETLLYLLPPDPTASLAGRPEGLQLPHPEAFEGSHRRLLRVASTEAGQLGETTWSALCAAAREPRWKGLPRSEAPFPDARGVREHALAHPTEITIEGSPAGWWFRYDPEADHTFAVVLGYVNAKGEACYLHPANGRYGTIAYNGGVWFALDAQKQPLGHVPQMTCAPWTRDGFQP